jgi:Na+/H+ antiporter NhaC
MKYNKHLSILFTIIAILILGIMYIKKEENYEDISIIENEKKKRLSTGIIVAIVIAVIIFIIVIILIIYKYVICGWYGFHNLKKQIYQEICM